ncbi:MAG: Arc family DNA binding domain-containing protein, partial [Gammaproteobacteria bacterium]
FPLRISPEILAAMQRWANDDLRSLNAQIEFVLRDSLSKAGRFRHPPPAPENNQDETA